MKKRLSKTTKKKVKTIPGHKWPTVVMTLEEFQKINKTQSK